jgi:hypothetical protein
VHPQAPAMDENCALDMLNLGSFRTHSENYSSSDSLLPT